MIDMLTPDDVGCRGAYAEPAQQPGEYIFWDLAPHPDLPEEVAFLAALRVSGSGELRGFDFRVAAAGRAPICHGWRAGPPPWNTDPIPEAVFDFLGGDSSFEAAGITDWVTGRSARFITWMAELIAAGWDWRSSPPAHRH